MAMEEDEDTVMGEAGPHQPNPVAHQHPRSSGQTLLSPFHGGSDPSLAPSIMGQSTQSMANPLPSRPPVPVPGDSQAKDLAKSVELGEPIGEPIDRADSPVEENSDWSDEEATSSVGIPLASLSSGLCYDVQMRYHCEVRPTADVHPEDPRRIYYIFKELCRAGLVDDPESSKPLVSRPLKRINARNATEAEISLVHTPDHFMFVESTKGKRSSLTLLR